MTNQHPITLQQGQPPRERGLGYALLGGLAITLVAMIIGGAAFAWILTSSSGRSAPELLPADTQLHLALRPNIGGVVEVPQLRQILRDELGILEPDALQPGVFNLAAVPLSSDNLGIWLGSELGVSVRGVSAEALAGPDPAAALLREGELIFFFDSKNDPQAEAFLEQHRAAREARGESFSAEQRGAFIIYAQQDGPPSPLAAFALIEHYVVFSNSRPALEALAAATTQDSLGATLAARPGFAQTRPGRYSDGSADAEAARAALRALLLEVGTP